MRLGKGMADKCHIAKEISDFFVKIANEDAFVRVRCDDAAWIRVEDGNTVLHCKRGKSLLLDTDIDTIGKKLPQYIFMRISHSEIVNIQLVDTIIGNILMTGSHAAVVGEEYRERVFACFQAI